MERAKKEYRELTVSEATNYGRKTAPMLRIQGLWFQELGFNIGDLRRRKACRRTPFQRSSAGLPGS